MKGNAMSNETPKHPVLRSLQSQLENSERLQKLAFRRGFFTGLISLSVVYSIINLILR